MLTDALVLKTWPYSESTLIVSLLTRDMGVVRVLAKGARRMQGQTAAAFDLFSQIRAKIRARSGEGLGNLSSVELRQGWMYLRTDLKRLALASVVMEVLGAVAAHSHPEAFFYEEAVEFLESLEKAAAPGSLAGLALLRLLHHAGHPPAIDERLDGEPLPDKMHYSFSRGEIIAGSADGPDAFNLPGSMVRGSREAIESPLEFSETFVLTGNDGRVFLRWLIRVWEDHLNQKLQSVEFLEQTVLSE